MAIKPKTKSSAETKKLQSEVPKNETGSARNEKIKIKRMTPAEIPVEMRELLLQVIKESQLQDWLDTRLPALNDDTPASLIRAGRTAGLMRLIGRAGIY
jgi:hypothetical protein